MHWRTDRSRLAALLLTASFLGGSACATSGAARPQRAPLDAGRAAAGFAVPTQLRPCCAFGHGLGVKLGALPIPLVHLDNVVTATDLGHHRYDASLLSFSNGPGEFFLSPERNGLVYTCRGGFIDIAHVRDYADWTVYLAREIEARLDSGGAVQLPDEGGRRFFYVTAIDPEVIELLGRRNLSVSLAQWVAFQLSVWHEIATWYGWSSSELFPEVASAFSPEDLYSNLLGIEIAGNLMRLGAAESEPRFNQQMDAAIRQELDRLGALPAELTREAARSVDGTWWDSSRRLPSRDLVLRRSLDLGPEIVPWVIPPRLFADRSKDAARERCGEEPRPWTRPAPVRVQGIEPERVAQLDIEVERALFERMPLGDVPDRWISERDFSRLVIRIDQEIRDTASDHSRG